MSERTYIGLHCDDCSVGTVPIGEYYMVKAEIWSKRGRGVASPGTRCQAMKFYASGVQQRLGRKLTLYRFHRQCAHQ